ncbi:srg family chemoreceptor domain-containing protein [Ditylenchus destructor]|nr:srg family chemoreceptor domain-containing protein [Ditylenchus destructor]
MGLLELISSLQYEFLYLAMAISVPSFFVYVGQIVLIVRRKQFHNSFFTLFCVRAIMDIFQNVSSTIQFRLPTMFGMGVLQLYSSLPLWLFAVTSFLNDYGFNASYIATLFIMLNRWTAIAMPFRHKKYAGQESMWVHTIYSFVFLIVCTTIGIATKYAYNKHKLQMAPNESAENNAIQVRNDVIEFRLLIYTLTTFIGHVLIAFLVLLNYIYRTDMTVLLALFSMWPLIVDMGTMVLASWMMLWSTEEIRKLLLPMNLFKKIAMPWKRTSTNTISIPPPMIRSPLNTNI